MLAGLRGGGKRLKIGEYGRSLSESKENLRKEYLPALNRVIEAYHAWYMTKGLWREGLHRELYKGRWRIENGHRDKGFFWGKTKSSSLKVRFYFAAVSFALYNAWQLERIGTTTPTKAVEVAAQLSHTFECLSLVLLKRSHKHPHTGSPETSLRSFASHRRFFTYPPRAKPPDTSWGVSPLRVPASSGG